MAAPLMPGMFPPPSGPMDQPPGAPMGGPGMMAPPPMGSPMMPPMPAMPPAPPPPVQLHDVVVVRRKTVGRAKVEGVPPEEFGISRRAKNIHDATYCFHGPIVRSRSSLIEDGYDEDQINGLPSSQAPMMTESSARDTVDETQLVGSDTINKANRPVDVTEHYIRMDYLGDGKSRLYRVTTATETDTVLTRGGKPDIEPVDTPPFAAMTPVIVTHRFFGRSIADLVMDIQRIKTALLRALLDNAYLANNQRMEISEQHAGKNTIDDLLSNRPGGIVRTKQPGGLNVIQNQPIGGHVFPMIEYMDSTREWRTGVTRQGQGIDANALQNQTAQAVSQTYTAAQARMRLIARIFAETGIRDLFQLLHGTIRKNDTKERMVRLRNKWVNVDPRGWKTRNDMTVSVGLGHGSKQEQLGFLMNILTIQEKAILQPGGQALVSLTNVYNLLKKVVNLGGLKSVDPYFTDPGAGPPQPPPPDPKMQELQARMQLEAVQAQADIAAQNAKAQSEMALAQKRFEFEKELKLIEMQATMQGNVTMRQMKQQEQEMNARLEMAKHVAELQRSQAQQTPSASIEVKHGADQITGPIADVVGRLGNQFAQSHANLAAAHAQGTQATLAALAQLGAPKRVTMVRDPATNRIVSAEESAL